MLGIVVTLPNMWANKRLFAFNKKSYYIIIGFHKTP